MKSYRVSILLELTLGGLKKFSKYESSDRVVFRKCVSFF
ncbi:hypothetical protein FLAVO9R_100001 [Flavobacterium sp. 9R]|nr:hypothetical protein FLAVO9R_100001 [Flavobacterium sp. 9R]